jgi:hypothetical protein
MKLGNRKLGTPNIELVIIPRGDGDDFVFKMQAVNDMAAFEEVLPAPEPPTILHRSGQKQKNVDDPKYIEAMEKYGEYRVHYMFLKSISITDNLEWETVDMADPDTWGNYNDELKAAGFSEVEVGRLIHGMMVANCLDDEKLEEARERFLYQLVETSEKSLTPADELIRTSSGESASD